MPRVYWWQPPFLLRTVIVNLKSGEVIQGVPWTLRGRWLTLKKAELLKANHPPTPIDGEAVVHRDEISFLQVLP